MKLTAPPPSMPCLSGQPVWLSLLEAVWGTGVGLLLAMMVCHALPLTASTATGVLVLAGTILLAVLRSFLLRRLFNGWILPASPAQAPGEALSTHCPILPAPGGASLLGGRGNGTGLGSSSFTTAKLPGGYPPPIPRGWAALT